MTRRKNGPQRAWALVVGVDEYREGWDWRLKGPVKDACDFVRWLRERGVPAEQIRLLLAPLAGDRPEADRMKSDPAIGVSWTKATSNAIHDALLELHEKQGDLLYLFLGGHGRIVDEERLLLTADARKDDPQNLNLDQLLKTLRTDYFQGFPRQVILVDACAEYVSTGSRKPPSRHLGRGKPSQPAQFVLYAAADGELAFEDSIRRTGDFSRVALDWLKEQDRKQWPPDFEALAEHVKDHFNQQTREKGTQTPIAIRRRGWHGEEADLFGLLEEFSDQSRFLREVRERLAPLNVDADFWHEIYLQTGRFLNRRLPETRSRDRMLRHLYLARPADRDRGDYPSPVEEFVFRAAQRAADPDLQQWIEERIVNKTELRNLQLRIEAVQATPIAYLMIELALATSVKSAKHPFVREIGWARWCGIQRCTIDRGLVVADGSLPGTQRAIETIVADARAHHSEDDLRVEFFVAREHLFSMAFDEWEYRQSPLGRNLPVSVRDRDASSAAERAAYLKKIQRRGLHARPAIQWLPDRSFELVDISPHFTHHKDCRAIFGLDVPASKATAFLRTLLDCGAPYLFWPRDGRTGKMFRSRLDRAARAGALERFPCAIYEYRNEKKVSPLTLYWDDPARPNPGLFDPAE
ncbi:MAG: caspase family protein [Blastocatellia bacterium]|nr:caspase family protein [Blastocatellia bacterium]